VNKVDSAGAAAVRTVVDNVRRVNPGVRVVLAASPPVLADGPDLAGARVLVVEDGPTITHGGMPFGAGAVAAERAGARELVDPRPYAVGSLREVFAAYPAIRNVLPAMGYGEVQLGELEATLQVADCDVVVAGTPIDLARVVRIPHPIRRVTYELREIGSPTLQDVLAPLIARWSSEPALEAWSAERVHVVWGRRPLALPAQRGSLRTSGSWDERWSTSARTRARRALLLRLYGVMDRHADDLTFSYDEGIGAVGHGRFGCVRGPLEKRQLAVTDLVAIDVPRGSDLLLQQGGRVPHALVAPECTVAREQHAVGREVLLDVALQVAALSSLQVVQEDCLCGSRCHERMACKARAGEGYGRLPRASPSITEELSQPWLTTGVSWI
jgi:hypothetical protein